MTAAPLPRAIYLQWHEWADVKSKTHRQVACPMCGLFVIWKRKTKRKPAA